MSTANIDAYKGMSEEEYKRRIRAWTMYDWANSAFATTILAAVLPVYYSQVAGGNLPSAAVATSYWSVGLSVSLLIIAILSPILGTVSDVMRGKKVFLAIFVGIGVVGTGLLVLVATGDWLLASILFILGRIGFSGANVFYDALLPHVAREEDRDKVSTRGYAMGYLGGGILLALNVVMIQLIPGTWGVRISFLSVAVWWAVFSIPIFRRVPEPPSAVEKLAHGVNVVTASFRRIRDTFVDIRRYRQLFKFLLAFFIYNDGIGTIIGVAVIYGAELGFGTTELLLAILLVQFVGIPFSLIFGRLPGGGDKRRPIYLAFILYNLVALPMLGVLSVRYMPADIVGKRPESYPTTASAVGEGSYSAEDPSITYSGSWESLTVPARDLGVDEDKVYKSSSTVGSNYEISFNGQTVEVVYGIGPEQGKWAVFLDGHALLDAEDDMPVVINAFNSTRRYEIEQEFNAQVPGEHTLKLVNSDQRDPESGGNLMNLSEIRVLHVRPQSNLMWVLGIILVVEVIGLALSLLLGRMLFSGIVDKFDTKRSILLALVFYMVIAVWGYFINSVIEFWALAWMVAVVQGGSQALSRSLYASMSPSTKSGEFFGLYGVMEKFSAIIGPLIFAVVVTLFGRSQPAILSLIVLFIVGGVLLTLVNVDEGKRVAQEEDARVLSETGGD
jgi:UMF1 family MFS transporter